MCSWTHSFCVLIGGSDKGPVSVVWPVRGSQGDACFVERHSVSVEIPTKRSRLKLSCFPGFAKRHENSTYWHFNELERIWDKTLLPQWSWFLCRQVLLVLKGSIKAQQMCRNKYYWFISRCHSSCLIIRCDTFSPCINIDSFHVVSILNSTVLQCGSIICRSRFFSLWICARNIEI